MLSTEPMMVRCLLRWKTKTIIRIILGHIIIAYNHIVGKSNVGKDYLDKGGLNLVEWIYWDKLAINFINGIRSLCRLNNSFAPHVWFHWWLVHVGLFLGIRGLALWGGGSWGGWGACGLCPKLRARRAPHLSRFILLGSFSDNLLVVSILDIVCDY